MGKHIYICRYFIDEATINIKTLYSIPIKPLISFFEDSSIWKILRDGIITAIHINLIYLLNR